MIDIVPGRLRNVVESACDSETLLVGGGNPPCAQQVEKFQSSVAKAKKIFIALFPLRLYQSE